tara:strand:+ start:7038 stop:7448 length:411 start_codon:yes stop_codon:yes gene_type:complete
MGPYAKLELFINKEKPMAKQGFSKAARLLGPAQFNPVFQKTAFKLSSPVILILVGNSDGPPRLGIIVAKKHIKTAVQRNRLKRIIRESFRLRQAEFGTIDLVVLARHGLDQLDNREVQVQMNKLLDELILKLKKKS